MGYSRNDVAPTRVLPTAQAPADVHSPPFLTHTTFVIFTLPTFDVIWIGNVLFRVLPVALKILGNAMSS
jgi:hypothetical protein